MNVDQFIAAYWHGNLAHAIACGYCYGVVSMSMQFAVSVACAVSALAYVFSDAPVGWMLAGSSAASIIGFVCSKHFNKRRKRPAILVSVCTLCIAIVHVCLSGVSSRKTIHWHLPLGMFLCITVHAVADAVLDAMSVLTIGKNDAEAGMIDAAFAPYIVGAVVVICARYVTSELWYSVHAVVSITATVCVEWAIGVIVARKG